MKSEIGNRGARKSDIAHRRIAMSHVRQTLPVCDCRLSDLRFPISDFRLDGRGLAEEREVNGLCHDPITGRRRMEMIPAVHPWREARRPLGIACDRVEVDHAVEPAARPDPGVDALAFFLGLRRVVELEPFERHERSAIDEDAVRVRALDDLFVREDDVVGRRRPLAFGARNGRVTNVVDPLENDQPLHVWLRQDVAVEAGKRIRAHAVAEEPISAKRQVEHGDRRVRARGMEPACQVVGPAIVAVGGRSSSVADRVAKNGNRRCRCARQHLHTAEEIPVHDWDRGRELERRRVVSRLQVRGRPRPRVPGHGRRRAA